ncbi:MAG: MaoC family dehydratase N-terminal domain-containing protein [Acidobacteria bacterium]|nr:MaoC family dehydratase N-terminal domain-containing protein [Acidobacteriota bacterium]
MSKYFEDFEVGEEAVTAGRTITETDIVNFAGLTGDWNEIHTNAELAANGRFKQRIAHGALIFSIATGLSVRLGQTADTVIAFYGLDRLRFVKPTFIGDTIQVRQKVEGKSERDDHSGIVTMLNEVINQRGEVAVSYTAKVLLKRRR